MITGEAFWKVLTEHWAALEEDGSRDWHIHQSGRHNELSWGLDVFLKQSEPNRQGVIALYLKSFWEDITKSPVDTLEDLRDEVAEFDGHLKALVNGKPEKTAKAGDKWVSPGRLVLTWPDLDLTARAVLFTMAAHGNDKGENIYVSQSSIGDYIGRDRTTVFRAMRRLEKAGAVTRTEKPRQHRPATYRINRGPRVV